MLGTASSDLYMSTQPFEDDDLKDTKFKEQKDSEEEHEELEGETEKTKEKDKKEKPKDEEVIEDRAKKKIAAKGSKGKSKALNDFDLDTIFGQ